MKWTKRMGRGTMAAVLAGGMMAGIAAGAQGQTMETYRVVHAYPHDPNAFTQGLVFLDGKLYESTGLRGKSSLREDNLVTGNVPRQVKVPAQYFAEGLTNWRGTLIQLTWQAHTAFVYDRLTFRLLKTLHYDGEGWGLTQDGRSLIMSDGSATLQFLDPETFRVLRRINVTDHGRSVDQLNELEYIRGEIWANVWHKDRIARISPRTGQVVGWIDMAGILPSVEVRDPEAVLNGIAYDAKTNRIFVTGKLWPRLYEIEVVPKHEEQGE